MTFYNNIATESGGGIYVEFPPIRFVVDIFNRLCFLQYNDGSGIDRPPQNWIVRHSPHNTSIPVLPSLITIRLYCTLLQDVTIAFINNQARLSGASIFASDMQQCRWLGSNFSTAIIFSPPEALNNSDYPFQYRYTMSC